MSVSTQQTFATLSYSSASVGSRSADDLQSTRTMLNSTDTTDDHTSVRHRTGSLPQGSSGKDQHSILTSSDDLKIASSVILSLAESNSDGEGSSEGTASWFATFFNLTNTAIGAGTLTLPYTLHQSGLALGTILILIVGVFSWFGLYFLQTASRLSKTTSFLGLAKASYGHRGELGVTAAMFLMLLGPLSAYFKIVGENLRTAVEYFELGHHADMWYTQSNFMMAIVGLGVMLPLSCLRTLGALANASIVALIAMLYAVVLIPFSFAMNERPAVKHVYWVNPSLEIIGAFSTIGMAYVNHAVVVECLSEMRPTSPSSRKLLTMSSSALITVVYIMVSIVGYLHFGDTVQQNILQSEPDDGWFTAARLAVALVVSLSFPLVCSPARRCLDWILRELCKKRKTRSETEPAVTICTWQHPVMESIRFYGETLFIFGISFLLAVAVSGIDKLFTIFGSLGGSLIVYVFPALFFLKVALSNGLLRRRGWLLVPASRTVMSPDVEVQDNDQTPLLVVEAEVADRPDVQISNFLIVAAYINVIVGLFLFFIGTVYSITQL